MYFTVYVIIKILFIVIPLLIGVALFTLAERKILSSIQRRRGPNAIGIYGLLSPLSDGLKLLLKETIIPSNANKFLFILAPILTFVVSLIGWSVIPISYGMVFADVPMGLLYILAVSSLGVLGIILAGWSSNSKYAFLGSLRSTAQMISYEVSIGFVLVSILICSGSLNMTDIVMSQEDCWYIFPLFPLFLIFLVSILAETNRHPFDLPEAEAELVSGYNVEYSAMGFALFFLGEYANMILMSSMVTILFLGGWHSVTIIDGIIPSSIVFSLKTLIFIVFFIWARAAYPRYRYDQLMDLGWKLFLPFSIGLLLCISGVFIGFGCLL